MTLVEKVARAVVVCGGCDLVRFVYEDWRRLAAEGCPQCGLTSFVVNVTLIVQAGGECG